jgi:hypothetical protein
MMIAATHILVTPLVLVIGTIDLYLALAGLRWILRGFSTVHSIPLYVSLQRCIDPLPAAVNRWIARRRGGSWPPWLGWVVVIGGGLIVRQLVLSLMD